MAVNGKLKSYLPYLAMVGIFVTLLQFSSRWGATTEKVQANERQIKMQDLRIGNEFKKMRKEQENWRKRDAKDRDRLEKSIDKLIEKLDKE